MCDYEYLCCTSLHDKLKAKIKGNVWIKAYRDELHIEIANIDCGLKYEYSVNDLSNRILHGLNLDEVACEITKNYKRYINNIFFR